MTRPPSLEKGHPDENEVYTEGHGLGAGKLSRQVTEILNERDASRKVARWSYESRAQ